MPDNESNPKEIVPKHSECIACGKLLDCSEFFNDCTVWRTHGNYGSLEFDPMSDSTVCEVVICDECLVKKSKVIRVVKRTTRQRIVSEQSFEDWKKYIKELDKKSQHG